MKHPSQSEIYVERFQRYLQWYPRSFRHHYGAEMAQLLRDQLEDAPDASLQREIYYQAVAELPFSILRERLTTPLDFSSYVERYGLTSWRLTSIVYLVSILFIGLTAFNTELVATTLLLFLAIPLLLITCWRYTGRITSAAVLIVVGLLAGLVLVYLGTATFGMLPVSYEAASFLQLTLIVGGFLLVPYLVLAYFHTHPERYGRLALAALSEEELLELQERNARRRRKLIQFVGGLITVFIILNLAGLYDPITDTTDLTPPEHSVARDQNAYYVAETMVMPESLYSSEFSTWKVSGVDDFLTGKSWDETTVQNILRQTDQLRSRFITAANLPAYQLPGLESSAGSIDIFKGIQLPANYHPVMQIMLLQAEDQFRAGNHVAALSTLQTVAGFVQHIQASNEFFVMFYSTAAMQADIAGMVTWMANQGLSQSEKVIASRLLPDKTELLTAEQNSLKWEFLLQTYHLPYWGDPQYGGWLIMPYTFQQNRTVSLLADHYRRTINNLENCSAEEQSAQVPWPGIAEVLTYDGIGKALASYAVTASSGAGCKYGSNFAAAASALE